MTTPNFEIPANIRELAEKSVDQAKTLYDQATVAGAETTAAFEKSATIVQSGTNEITTKAVDIAKANIESSLDLAKKLVAAKDIQEAIKLQTSYVQDQLKLATAQTKEFGELSAKLATDASAPVKENIETAVKKSKDTFTA